MGKSTQFNRDDDPGVKNVMKAGPLGILPVLWLIIAGVVIVALLFWWLR